MRDFDFKIDFLDVRVLCCHGFRRLADWISTELTLRVWALAVVARLGLELYDMIAEIVRFLGNLMIWLAESLSEELAFWLT